MVTELPAEGSGLGTSSTAIPDPQESRLRDASGVMWTARLTWGVIGGRAEVTALELDSGGRGRLTATLLRRLEGVLREERQRRVALVERVAREPEEGGERARRQLSAYRAARKPGPRRDDTVWRRRAETIAAAWASGQPMIQALRELEPGGSESIYRKRIDRARAWDQEANAGILSGVGRAGAVPPLAPGQGPTDDAASQ